MAYYTWSDGQQVTAAILKANVQDQVITQCTSSTRPGSPVEGMCIFETDTDRIMVYDGAAWDYVVEPRQTWTPTVTQGSAVSGTVDVGWSRRIYGHWEAQLRWISSAAGTAANKIEISTPFTLDSSQDLQGTWFFNDNGTGFSTGVAIAGSTTVIWLYGGVAVATDAYGVNPAITIASGDILRLRISGTY